MRESEDRGEETKIQVDPNLVQTGVNIDLLIRELTVKKHSHLVWNQYQYLSLDTRITSSCFYYDNRDAAEDFVIAKFSFRLRLQGV